MRGDPPKIKRKAMVTIEKDGHTKALQSCDSVIGGSRKIGIVKAKHTISAWRGEETRIEIAVLRLKEGKYIGASFSMNLRRYQAERLAVGIAPWLKTRSNAERRAA